MPRRSRTRSQSRSRPSSSNVDSSRRSSSSPPSTPPQDTRRPGSATDPTSRATSRNQGLFQSPQALLRGLFASPPQQPLASQAADSPTFNFPIDLPVGTFTLDDFIDDFDEPPVLQAETSNVPSDMSNLPTAQAGNIVQDFQDLLNQVNQLSNNFGSLQAELTTTQRDLQTAQATIIAQAATIATIQAPAANPQARQPPANAPLASSNVRLNGVELPIIPKDGYTNVAISTIVPKGQRASISEDERLKIRNSCCSKVQGCLFRPIPSSLDDKQLQQVFNLDACILAVKEHMQAYDIADVFTLVLPVDVTADADLQMENELDANGDPKQDANGNNIQTAKTKDLLSSYASIDIATIANSNTWYHKYTNDHQLQFHTNLDWSYHVLKANIEPSLMSQLQAKYDKFPPLQQGGPLLFGLLMKSLLHTNDSVVRTLTDQIKKYKISSHSGEDIDAITPILLSASQRIWHAKKERFPDNFLDYILTVLQTTSNAEFNAHFHKIDEDRKLTEASEQVDRMRGNTPTSTPSMSKMDQVETWLNLASALYQGQLHKGTWKVRQHPRGSNGPSALKSGSNNCFNCGKPNCRPDICSEPLDKAKIARAKKAFMEKKAKAASAPEGGTKSASKSTPATSTNSSGAPSKWRAPNAGESYTRNISHPNGTDPVPYKWNKETRRWVRQTGTAGSKPSANTAISSSTSTRPTSPTPRAEDVLQSSAELRASLASIQKTLLDNKKDIESIRASL